MCYLFRKTWLTCLLVLGLSACQSTEITNIWSETPTKTFRSMLVIAVFPEENVRRTIEDSMVATLKQNHLTDASAFYRLYPDTFPMDEASLSTLWQQSNAESVLIIKPIRQEERIRVQSMPTFGFYGHGRRFYSDGWYGAAPIVTPYMVGVLDLNLWDVQTGKLAWSASSEAMNPNEIKTTANSLAQTTLKALLKQGWIMAPTQ